MKIAILGQYPLDTERLGGVEVAIVYAQRELLKIPGVELHIITCKPQLDQPKIVEGDRCTVTYLPRQGLGRITWHRAEVSAISKALRATAPDIVHAHGSGFYAGAALASPYPTVVTVHGIASREARLLTTLGDRARGLLDALYERSVVRRTRHLILITPYVEQVFAGLFHGRSYLVENACDERFFDIARRPIAGRLLFAGPVLARKGVLPLIRALAWARRSQPQAHLRIAGSTTVVPEYYQACLAAVREEGLGDAVTFLGHLAQERVLEEYTTCAAFVLPSFQETAPMVIEQAMAAGAPSIATRAGGVPGMLDDGATGLTLPTPASEAGDPQALAEAMVRLLQHPDEAALMGQRAKIEAEKRFRPETVARRTYEVYQRVIEAER